MSATELDKNLYIGNNSAYFALAMREIDPNCSIVGISDDTNTHLDYKPYVHFAVSVFFCKYLDIRGYLTHDELIHNNGNFMIFPLSDDNRVLSGWRSSIKIRELVNYIRANADTYLSHMKMTVVNLQHSFTIESNIPIPRVPVVTTESKFHFADFKVNDSIFIPFEHKLFPHSGNMRHILYRYNKSNPDKKFIMRKLEGGVRIWRIL